MLLQPSGISLLRARYIAEFLIFFQGMTAYTITNSNYIQWRSEGGGAGGASAPGRRLEGGARIMPKNFLKFIY